MPAAPREDYADLMHNTDDKAANKEVLQRTLRGQRMPQSFRGM